MEWNFRIVTSCVYTATAVHMLSDKAHIRALRAHFLVQSALEPIIFQSFHL